MKRVKSIDVIEYIDKEENLIIKRNLANKGIQCKDVAKKLNISRQYLSNMLNGKKPLQYYLKNCLEENRIFIFED